MAYVTTFGRSCGHEGCSKVATLVVRNQYNADCNYFCERHKRQADALAAHIDEDEKRTGRKEVWR